MTGLHRCGLRRALFVTVAALAILGARELFAAPGEPVAQAAATTESRMNVGAMIFDEGARRLLTFPAYRGANRPGMAQLWSWNGRDWELVQGTGPDERDSAAVAYDSHRKRLVVHGGRGSLASRQRDDRRGDTWEWDGQRWHEMKTAAVVMRDHHAMAYDAGRRRMVMYGGVSSDRTQPSEAWVWDSDVWEWDGANWTKIVAAGPGGRVAFALVYDPKRKKVVLFGGTAKGGARFNDTWEWDGRAWKKVSEAGPPVRLNGSVAFDRRRGVMLLFGGAAGSEALDDMWQWDGKRWTELTTSGPRPRKRNGARMAYDTERKRMMLYGGFIREGQERITSNEMWEWDGKQWKQVQ